MNLKIIERRNQRVLTTAQLAESYGTDNKTISNNFTRNKNRYTEGKHFFQLTGDKLREFKALHQIDEHLKFTSVLYLWTEKGAWLHAKSLNTDQAWDAYKTLVDDYYYVKENAVEMMTVGEMKRWTSRLSQILGAAQINKTKRLEQLKKDFLDFYGNKTPCPYTLKFYSAVLEVI